MPRDDTPRLTAADYRKFAGDHFLDAAKAAFSGSIWIAKYEAEKAVTWIKRADEMEKAAAEADRAEAECTAFNAAMAECA